MTYNTTVAEDAPADLGYIADLLAAHAAGPAALREWGRHQPTFTAVIGRLIEFGPATDAAKRLAAAAVAAMLRQARALSRDWAGVCHYLGVTPTPITGMPGEYGVLAAGPRGWRAYYPAALSGALLARELADCAARYILTNCPIYGDDGVMGAVMDVAAARGQIVDLVLQSLFPECQP